MTRKTILAAALGLGALGLPAAVPAQSLTTGTLMQPGQRMQLTGGLQGRVVRQVMIAPDGGGIDIIYDMPAGAPESKRVLRLENVNGMLEVIYDTAMPRSMALGKGGAPQLVAKGDGSYEVTYQR